MKRWLCLFCVTVLLSGCGALSWWQDEGEQDDAVVTDVELGDVDLGDDELDGEDDEEAGEPRELRDYEEAVRIKKRWRTSVGKSLDDYEDRLQPVLYEGQVYAADTRGRVSALSLEDGDRIWRTDLEVRLTGGVGAGAGLVLVGSLNGELIALSGETGEEQWRMPLTSEILAPPVAQDGVVVAQTQDGKLHGLAVADGTLLWRFVTDVPVLTLRGTATPVVLDGRIYAGFGNGKVISLALEDGTVLWEARLSAGEGKTELERIVDVNTPVPVGDVVYVTSYQGRAGALSRGAGRELWTNVFSSHRAPAYQIGRMYVVETGDSVSSLRASNGDTVWTNEDLLRRKLTAPLAIKDFVAVADGEGYLHLLAFEDGRTVGRVKVDGDGVSINMITDDELLLVQDNSGDLTAYELLIESD